MTWHDQDKEDTTIYKVVVNHEEQYSIWPNERENAFGWRDAGRVGTKSECLEYVKEVWTDMRPLSLRQRMADAAKNPPPPPSPAVTMPAQTSLVERLASGKYPVEFNSQIARNGKGLKEAIDRGYVHLKFRDTKGGTTLGVRVDPDGSDLTGADFENDTGTIHLEGTLTLDFVKVRCISNLALETVSGTGNLVVVSQ